MRLPRSIVRLVLSSVLLLGCEGGREAPPRAGGEGLGEVRLEGRPEAEPGRAVERRAVADLVSAPGQGVTAHVELRQDSGPVTLEVTASGLRPGLHGFHIHETGSCVAPDFNSAGAHFAPTGKPHGPPSAPDSHAGDLGNLAADAQGKAAATMTVDRISLTEGEPGSVIGRALVIHAEPDDLRSQPSGDAGGRLACGVIRALGRSAGGS